MSTIADRVAAGAAFLDEHDPEWWRADVERAIDLDELEMADAGSCVLGQRCPLEVLASAEESAGEDTELVRKYDAYAAALFGIRLESADTSPIAADHGFTCVSPTGSFADLTAEWTRVITERRAAA